MGSRQVVVLTLFASAALTADSSRVQAAPPASVDRTTPRTQQGLTLLAVSRGDAQGQYQFPVPQGMDFLTGPRGNGPAGGIGLWVRGFKPAAPNRPDSQPTVFVTALNNDVLPAQIEPVSSYSNNSGGSQPAPLYLVTLPGGYPSGYPAIDVSVNNFHGNAARWRLINLAAPYHAIAPPVALHSSFAGAGVKLNVHAWRDTGYVPSGPKVFRFEPDRVGIHYRLAAQVPAGSHWSVRINKRQIEWEAVHPGEMQALQARYRPQYARHPYPRPVLWTAELGTPTAAMQSFAYPMQDMVPTPYSKYNHFLRVSGELVQLATTSETITFHNLNVHQSKPPVPYNGGRNVYTPPPSYEIGTRPQTQVTPSGISVSLLALSALGPQGSQFGGYGMPGSIRMVLRFRPGLPGQSPYQQASLLLPRSPLYRKYHKPVSYVLQAQRPYSLQPLYGGFGPQSPGAPAQMLESLQLPFSPPVPTMQNGRMIYKSPPNHVPKYLNTLTLSVVQTAELRTIPISFVVPVGAQAPMQAAPARGRHFLPRR